MEIREGGRRHADTWADLRREMRTRFIPAPYTRDFYNKWQRMYKGSKSMEEYHKDMEVALTRTNVPESSEATMAKFRSNMSPKKMSLLPISQKVEIKLPNTPPTSKSNSIMCFKCLGKGHITFQCPNKRSIILL
ncbi:hypothetical protein CR513_15382, partial [Mucuna pruriens]